MRQIEIIARSENQALEKAAAKLEVERQEVEILEEYEPDELDLKNLEEEESALAEEEKEGEPVLYVIQVSMRRAMEEAREWVQGLVDRFQPGAEVKTSFNDGQIVAGIEAPDPSIFIGKNGHTLAALQHVVTRVVPRKIEDCPQIMLDVGDYRDRKQEQLERIAEGAVRRALRTRKSVSLRPMPSTDRKFVHNLLKDHKGIQTSSYGSEPNRHIVIEVAGGRSGGKRGRGGGGGRGGDRRRGGGGGGNRKSGGGHPNFKPRRSDEELLPPMVSGNRKDEPDNFEDVDIEETPKQIFSYNPKEEDSYLLDPERPMVDELIDE